MLIKTEGTLDDLLIKKNGEYLVSSERIALLCEKERRKTFNLIKENQDDFNEFGSLKVYFESTPKNQQKASYLLNENQAYLLLTFFRNNAKVREAKKNLIKAYATSRQLVRDQAKELTRKDLALMIVAAEEEKEQLLLENKKQTKEIKTMEPKVDFYEKAMDSSSLLSMKELANTLAYKNMGRNKLFKFLREQKVLNPRNEPYQKYITASWFKVIITPIEHRSGKNLIIKTTTIYPKGMAKIKILLDKAGHKPIAKE